MLFLLILVLYGTLPLILGPHLRWGIYIWVHYLVEGECEKKLIDTFKEQKNIIVPGKVIHFNVIQEHITPAFLRTISNNTTVILVFDTDTNSADILEKNIALLSNHPHIKEVWCVIQVQNLEDEILRSTDLSDVTVLTGSKSCFLL